MTTFWLWSSDMRPVSFLSFYTGVDDPKFQKPKEIGRTIASRHFNFKIQKEELGQAWFEFVDTINQLLNRSHDLEELNLNGDVGRNGYRMVLCGASNINLNEQDGGRRANEPEEVVKVPMKVKLISNILLDTTRDKERGCLAQLTKLCGHENMEVVVKDLDAAYWLPRTILETVETSQELKMSWNKEELCWETDTELSFPKSKMSGFGKKGGQFRILVGKVELKLNNVAVARVLQRLYGRPDDSWRVQKQVLQNGELSDMEISSSSGGNTSFKCHRLNLTVASPVFAKMLEEDETLLEGPSAAKRGKWKEAQALTVKLTESVDAIEAMLHFIYYGGCERIFRNRVEVILELLEAGEKYQIQNLKNVAAFVLMTDAQEENWFTVDAAMKLFHFARRLEGKLWKDLKVRSIKFLMSQPNALLMAHTAYQELHDVGTRLGPIFVLMMETTRSNSAEEEKDNWKPASFPYIGQNVTKEEAMAIYDWIDCMDVVKTPKDWNVALGIMILAEFCEVPFSALKGFSSSSLVEQFLQDRQFHRYEVDYLVELFSYFRQKDNYKELKIGAVRLLKAYMVEDRQKILESKKYWEMLQKDPEAFEEFTWLGYMEYAGDIRKFSLHSESSNDAAFSVSDKVQEIDSPLFWSSASNSPLLPPPLSDLI